MDHVRDHKVSAQTTHAHVHERISAPIHKTGVKYEQPIAMKTITPLNKSELSQQPHKQSAYDCKLNSSGFCKT